MKDKRDQLYNNLINSGKVSEAEIGNLDEFKSAISDEAKTREFYNNIIKSGLLTENEIGSEDDFYGSISDDFATPQQPQTQAPSQGYQPTAEDMAAFGKTIGGARQAVGQSQQTVNRIGNMQQRAGLDLPQNGRINLGENRKVTKGQERYNIETGQMENTYVTEQGNEYNSRELADLEQNAVDQEEWRRNNPEKALESDIDRQIADLQAKRDEAYNAALEKARAATVPQSGIGKAIHDFFTPENQGMQMLARDRAMDIALNDKNVAALDVALRDLQEAKTMMERNRQLAKSSDFLGGVGLPFTKDWFNNWQNFGYGVWDSMGDVAFNFFGNNDIQKAAAYLRIKDKMEKGEELTDTETDMALAGMALAQAQQLADLPTGYTAGQTTLEMAPFMFQMAANPAGGIGKALARKAVKKFGRNGLKAVTARMAARIGGNIGEAAVLSNTLQAGKTAADIAMRHAGDSFSYDEDGNIIQGHYIKDENGENVFVEGGKDLAQAAWEGEAASIIENFTELGFGGNIGKALSKAAGSKLGSKIGLGYISDLVGKVGSTPFARSMKRFMERTHWDGMIEEPLEEEYGIILNSLLTGDNQISDLWDSKQQADIFAGTMWFGGMMAVMNTAAYPFAKRDMKRKLNNADVEGEMAFRDEWPVMKAAVDDMDDSKIADFLYGLKDDKSFTKEQKAALFGYAARLKQYQGANVADMLMRMEGNLSNEESVIKNAYDAGTEVEDPDEMKTSVDEAEAAGQKLTQYGPEFTSMVVNGSVDPASTINYMMNNRDYYSDEEIAAAADYYQKHARAQGVMDGQLDKIDLEVQKANAEVASNTHQATGQVITAQIGDGAYYIIGGDVAIDEDTGMPVVTGTGGAVVVKDPVTGEVSVKPASNTVITSMTNADEMIQYNEEVLRQQLMQQADDDITFGSPASEVYDLDDTVTLQDGEGGMIEGQVVTLPNAVDGVFVIQTNDGRALQMAADDMNRRIVAHNGMEVQRASTISPESDQVSDQVTKGQINGQTIPSETPAAEVQQPVSQKNEKGEKAEPQQSALSRIPVRTDKEGQPLKNKKGRPILDWHKASVEDAAAALVETTGGDMVLARDTASDLVKNEQARLEKIRKQKPTGDDPIEIAESRVAIRKQEQEQQAIIKQWQDVGNHLRKQMETEAAEKRAAEEAAKSEEQRQREAEEARIRKEKQDAIAAERRRKQIEEEVANWNKPYAPLAKARKEMENDREAMGILDRTEPESLEEWVSSLIQPQSMMWDDEKDPVTGRTVIGLQSELGLQKKDIERIGGLVAPRSKGGRPFGQVVHDIWEALPEGMKQMYDDQDVRNALIGLFGEGNAMRMRHLTEEHRIEEARQLLKENARRDAEAEMDAWAEFYHLNPEERETFEDFIKVPPTPVESDIINQIIADNEQNRRSEKMDLQPVSGSDAAGIEGGEGQVRQAAEAAGNGNPEQGTAKAPETAPGEPPAADNNVPGGESIFVTPVLNVSLSRQLVNDLAEAYASGDPSAIQSAVVAMKAYVDEGGDFENKEDDSIYDYDGNDPQKLALQYKSHLLLDTYLEDDEDQEYIKTGLKPEMRQSPASPDEQFTQSKLGVYPAQTGSLPSLNSEEEAGNSLESFVQAARNGDVEAQKKLESYGLSWEKKPVVRFISQGEFDSIMAGNRYEGRFGNGVVDVTNQVEVTTAASADYRVTFKDELDWTLSDRLQMKNEQLGDGWLKDGYGLDDVARIEKRNPDGTYSVVYDASNPSQPIGKTSTPEEIQAEEAKVDTNPTEGQKEAGNYQKGHINIDGYDISIENPKGSIRRGTDANGKQWETTMHNTYGYIRGTEGVDGDHIDVFLSDEPASGSVFVVDQINPDTLEFDEHKVMYGFPDAESAEQAYLSNYEEGWGGLGEITEVSREEFKKWVESSHRKTKPFAEYKSVKQRPGTDTPEGEILVKGGTIMKNNIAGGNAVVKIVGSNIDKKTGKRRYSVEYYTDEQAVKERIAIGDAEIGQDNMRRTLASGGFTTMNKGAAETQQQPKPERQHKRIVSDDQMEDLKKKLREKFGTLNAGIDVERMLLGAMYAVGKIERGVTKFADYAAEMVDEIGDAIRPYLKAFYEAVRNMPEAAEYRDQMTSPEEVAAFDEYNFDKKQKTPDAFTKAEQVVQKQKAKQQVKKIEKEVKQKIQGGVQQLDLFGEPQEPVAAKEKPIAKVGDEFQGNEGAVNVIVDIDESGDTRWYVYDVYLDEESRKKGEKFLTAKIREQDLQAALDTREWSKAKQPVKPQLNKKDYRTYMTPEAREYFAHDPRFAKFPHPELAFVTAAVWDGVVIPVEELAKIPTIVEAEQRVKAKEKLKPFSLTDEEVETRAQRLLDAEHGSAVYKEGKLQKADGHDDFSGPVRQERKAFIIIGRPAGGKSSVFANPLSNKYGARIIDSDTVKEWFDEFDDGYGAGYVQEMSSKVAERALDIAAQNGDNVILPRIGGNSVMVASAALRLAGYDVQLYYNDVVPDTSYMRSQSRFAMTGRYLSLDYLTSIKDKPSKTFSNFAEKSIGDYINECTEEQIQKLRGRLERLVGGQRSDLWRALSWPLDEEGRGDGNGTVSGTVERSGADGNASHLDLAAPIFSYAEWKSNDVAFGEKPKEIWNSKSGKPMPGKEKESNNNSNELHSVRSEQGLSAESSPSGEGAGQASGSAERPGAERSPEQDRAERSGRGHSVETVLRVPEEGEETRDSSGGLGRRSGGDARVNATTFHKNRRNNVGERGKDYAPLSPKARFNANVEAIKMMRALMEDGVEAPTKDQMEVFRKYSGWGGMGTFFNDATTPEYRTLMDLLDEDEFKTAAMSINSAYFTPAMVIDSMWDIAEAMGFKGGNVLEGSAGIGNIIGQMPQDMSRRSDIEAVEIDKISGNILKLLYPDAKVHIQGFQDTKIPNGSVDLAITNVPFVTGLHVFDKVDKDLSRKFTNIHDFCIAKNIRKLREGGIGIFISSSGTLDKSNDLRAWITDEGQADVVGAFRLNNETFGGTTATSDIIIVRKRVNNQKSPNAIDISSASPMRVGSYEDKSGNEKQTTMTVNDYFQQHPEMMAGEMAFGYEKGDTFRPGSYGLYPVEGKSQEKMLQDFVKEMDSKKETASTKPQTQQEPVKNQLTAEKEGRMLIDDNGRLCISRMGTAVPLALNDQKVKGQTKQQCFKDYQDVQKAVDDVLQQQLNDPDDTKLQPKLKALNAAYDKFIKRYGTLHKNTSISFLRNDIDFPSFLALENYSETKDMKGKVIVTTKKAPLFSQRVLGFKTEPKPKTVKDAVIASMFRSNGIDLEWIAEKLSEVAAPPNGDKWTADDVRKGILVSRLGFEDPSTGQIEIRYKYLSGNVREKLAIAEAYNTDGKYAANVEELRKAVPMDIPSHLIEFSIGSSWIPIELYKDYLKEVYDLTNVSLSHVEGSWVMSDGWYRNEKNRAAGIYSEQFRETIYGHQLVAAAMNNRPIKVAKQVSEGYGSNKTTRTVVDKNATQACAVRVDEIKDEFKQWAKKKMQDDPELAARIEKIYNDKFNALVPMEIDEEFLPEHFEGSNVNITLRPHQKTGTMRGLTAPTMLAHEVGTGKSFTLITTAMEMRRLGTARKPMLVVQNATVAQLTSDAKLLYPNAKVLALTEKDRDAEGRRAFYASIKYNDWDLIIIPQSTLNMIPDSPERELQFIQEKIDEKKHVIEAAMQSGMDSREIQRLKKELDKLEEEYGDTYLDKDPANGGGKKKKKDTKREAASLDKAETKAKEQLDRQTDDVQFFDDLGVDALLVDEAHEYKHLGFQTSIGRGIKGVDPSYSKKCAGLYNKTRSVYEKAGWKNVVFATGTPISNTAAEIWTFMKYLMPADMMRANDIYYFDDFVHNFGSISQSLEFATSGKFKENTRFAAYVNKPELIRIWSQVADTVLTKDAKSVQDKLPQKEGGKDQDVFLPQSPSLVRIMTAVRAELERFENMTGQEKKENSSIPLTMYGIAKRAAIDPRLVDPNAPDEPTSKTNSAVKEIVKDLKATANYKGTVAVFCDNQNRLGTNAAGKKVVEFNIYDDMKQKLMSQGVPENQIAIVKSGMSITAKQKIFDAVNAGTIRVVLGSTQTLGTGVNMQERLHLLIHMDAPDRPMDYTQRNGRIERQGNLHKEWGKTIRIVRFGVEDSLDVTAYQRLKTKSGFIDSIMDGKAALANNQVDRTVEEEEEGLFDNPVAVLSGSQYALKKNQAERELRKYQGKKSQWEADQTYVTNQLRRNKREVEAAEASIKDEEKELAHIRSLFPDGKVKTITVEGVKIDMTKDNGAKLFGEALKEKVNDPVNAIVKRNRENPIYNDETMTFTIALDGHDVNFKVQIMRESVVEQGKMRTVIHKYTSYTSSDLHLDSFTTSKSVRDELEEIIDQVVTGQDYQDRIDAYKAKIDRLNAESEQLEKRVGMEFQYGKELEQAQKNVEEYTQLMKKEMEEKEAKYAAQQKEAKENGGFDLSKAEDSEEDEDVRFSADEDWDEPIFRQAELFSDGEAFPIHSSYSYSKYDVTGQRKTYTTDLLPDTFMSLQSMLDAVRNAYPDYYATIEDNNIKMQSWDSVMAEAENARDIKESRPSRARKGAESYIERKTRRAVNAVNDMAERMHLDVEVLTTTDGLTGKKARSKGWFNPKTHKIVIVLPNHRTQSDVINTLLHEGVAHYGLRNMFGQNFDTFLDNVYNNVSPEIRARIDAAMKRNGWGRYEATEEYLARLAEQTDFERAVDSGWWQKIKDFFMEMLAKVGFNTQLTDNELRYILWRSYDHLIHPDYRRNLFDTAKEIQMKTRLKVGDYAERVRMQRTGSTDTSPMVADRVNEEMLNRDIEDVPSQELLLSLSQKEGDERNEAINELVRRVREGDARIVRMGKEVELDRGNDAQIAGAIIGGWQQLGVSSQSDGTLRSMVQGRSEMVSGSSTQGKDTTSDNELPIITWAKATGHYFEEEQVKAQSLDKDIWRRAGESKVYRTADGKRVIKFMEAFAYYDNPLLKRIDDLTLQNSVGFEHLNVLGYSLDEGGRLQIVLEQDFIDGVTIDDLFDDDGIAKVNNYINRYLENVLGLVRHYDENGNIFHMKDGLIYKDLHGGNILYDSNNQLHVIDCLVERDGDSGKERGEGFSIEDNDVERYSIRTKEPPKKTGKGYKVFVLKDGQLYPPMVANPNGEGTPVGVWLDADAAPVAGTSKTGRPQVKAGGKGTQGGSGQLAYRPGWHLGEIPYALQFNRKDENGERTLFPNNFVWAEVEYADDVDYQDEARQEGMNANGNYQHSLAGLKHVPTDGSYKYRTNPDPRTDEWVITGAMRVNRILSREEVDELVRKAGREPQPIQDGDILTKETLDKLNSEIKAYREADEMGLLYRDDDAWTDDVAQEMYEEAVAKDSLKWQESWQDSMVGLKAIQDAIAAETGRKATGAEDAYRYENRMHGRAKNMTEQYDWRYYRPMLKAFNDFCKANGMTQQEGIEYLISKSGLERNVYYAFRDAAQAKLADDIKKEREKLEKDYAKKLIDEGYYILKKKDIEEKERNGVDDIMRQVRETLAYQRAKEDYQNGTIGYTEYLRRIEAVIRSHIKDYDTYAKDYSGLTETFAKEMYDAAQSVKKQAQRAVDPQERRELWREYDTQMRQAYELARQVAEDAVFAAENGANVNDLWEKINAATKETLKHNYESGLMSRDTYNKVRAMFDYYIPLRGWEEDKAADVYSYMGKDNVFNPAVKKTWGRKSQAENPLAYIGNIAVSTILSGHRNQMKQHFLNYVMNNPTSLVNISESWYENIGNEGDSPVWVLRTADTAGKTPDEIVQIVNDFNEEMRLKQREGKAMPVTGRLRLDVHATSGQKAEHVVEVQRAGHTYQLYINGNPKAAQALNGSAARAVSRISQTYLGREITKLNRSMAMFFTSKNPAFVVSNLSRDLNMAGASVAIKEGAEYNARFLANVAKVLTPRLATGDMSRMGLKGLVGKGRGVTGMMPKLMAKWKDGKLDMNDETQRLFKEFMDEGGETGFVNMLSVDSFKEKMQKEIKEMNGSSIFGKGVKETSVHKGLRMLGDTFEFYNRCAEDATRFIVYMTSRQMGKTLEESIADAKDVTLNFNRKGTGDKGNAEIRDLFIFVNPAIQALANMYKMATGHPLKFGAVTAAFVAGGMLMPIINQWLLNLFGDDDDKDTYWNLPPWVRKNNFVMWVPGTKNFVTIPLAQEFRVFYGVGEMISSGFMDHPITNVGLEVFSSVADLVPINPTGNGGNLMVDFAPTMVQPLMQVGENIDFTGKPIWKENQGNKHAPMYEKAYVSTPAWMVKLSEAANSLTGGNEGRKGYVEKYAPFWGDYINNPAVWNHLLQGYFGGMYNTIAKSADVIVTTFSGEMPKVYQTPVVNRFLNRPVERDNAGVLGEEYYSLTEERDALQYELRTWQRKAADGEEGAQEHVDEIVGSDEYKRAEVISHYERILKDLKAGEKAATESADKADIKRSISLYKEQMMEELEALDEGKSPLEAATEAYEKASTFAEKNRLRMRIERLMMRENAGKPRTKGRTAEVEKALGYITDEERESRDTNDRYLDLATAQDILGDARIKAVKAKLKPVADEYRKIQTERPDKAADYYRKHERELNTYRIIDQQSRLMQKNKKLLGKGSDKAIMKLIGNSRTMALKTIEGME